MTKGCLAGLDYLHTTGLARSRDSRLLEGAHCVHNAAAHSLSLKCTLAADIKPVLPSQDRYFI